MSTEREKLLNATTTDVMNEMEKFLDLAATAVAYADTQTLAWVGFVWGQRGDHIMAGEETFEDQNPPTPTLMSRF